MMVPAFEIKVCKQTLALPQEAKILVIDGDEVKEGELLAETSSELKEFNLAKVLQISPSKVKKFLSVAIGSKVKKGQIIAQKKSFLRRLIFQSPVSGLVEGLTEDGVLKIKVGEKITIKAPVEGRVKENGAGELSLEFEANVLTSDAGQGEAGWGEIEVLGQREEEINLDDLPISSAQKIIVLGGRIPSVFIYKAEALGATGLVGGSLDREVKPYQLSILMAGEKDGLIPEGIWVNLKKHQGRKAFISGTEKILEIPVK